MIRKWKWEGKERTNVRGNYEENMIWAPTGYDFREIFSMVYLKIKKNREVRRDFREDLIQF